MNRRIQELATQVGISVDYLTNTKQIELIEKFAELIVKECMKAADEGMAQVTMRVEWPSYHIKKHFGVEE